ncbi:alpha/beta-hydrolase [Marasmius fiardii PR-910]|nr:alpha/beta-hydrolase [Marasmius fiardii PR-910]
MRFSRGDYFGALLKSNLFLSHLTFLPYTATHGCIVAEVHHVSFFLCSRTSIMNEPLTATAPDGASLAYEILGAQWIGRALPIVLVGGMTSLRGDWERLAIPLATRRPVLIYDHRGMGDSTYSTPARNDDMTVESLARDLLAILTSLRWQELAICGFSMGGVVAQQLLFLQYHPTNPVSLPFSVTHVILASTLCATIWTHGLRLDTSTPSRPLTVEEKKARVKPVLNSTLDPEWLADPNNKKRYEFLLNSMLRGRPTHTISKQGRALRNFSFRGLHEKLPRSINFLVLHGEKDTIVPISCGQELLQRIPWSRSLQIGDRPGEVPSLGFGHQWFEYFDPKVWVGVVETFLNDDKPSIPSWSRL